METEANTQDVSDALTVVNDAANDARHRGDYDRANALVRARVTLYQAARELQQAQPADVWESYKTWPADIRAKLSCHDLRRMSGWAAKSPIADWRIDTSAGGPILVYQNCSVIESEQAQYVLNLTAQDQQAELQQAQVVGESLSRQGGDMSKNPENLDTSAERVYGIDTSQVEYDRELIAKMLADYAYPDPLSPRHYAADAIRKQAELLIAADNRDAAGVRTVHDAAPAPGDG